MTDDIRNADLAAEASEESSQRAAEHIERAALKNQDPEVADELRDAAIAADTTIARVGWLRSLLRRLFGRGVGGDVQTSSSGETQGRESPKGPLDRQPNDV
jgi:hypothetical protein